MIDYIIEEVCDGEVPFYRVVEVETSNRYQAIVHRSFCDMEQAEEYLQGLL